MIKPSYKGFFLAIEGPDGSGKTTLRTWLNEWFRQQGIDVMLTREPGGTPMAERIREVLLMNRNAPENAHLEPTDPIAETLMFMAARAQHYNYLLRPALQQGRLIISDRFCDSTFAYQGAGRGLSVEFMQKLHNVVFGENVVPDLTIVLDGDPEFFRDRMVQGRGEIGMNHFDNMPIDFHKATREVYLSQAAKFPERYAVIDAMQCEDQVQAQVIPYLMKIGQHLRRRPDLT